MNDTGQDEARQLQALANAQGLTLAANQLAAVGSVHADHLRQAAQLRAGVTLLDEPATIFRLVDPKVGEDAASQRA